MGCMKMLSVLIGLCTAVLIHNITTQQNIFFRFISFNDYQFWFFPLFFFSYYISFVLIYSVFLFCLLILNAKLIPLFCKIAKILYMLVQFCSFQFRRCRTPHTNIPDFTNAAVFNIGLFFRSHHQYFRNKFFPCIF
jgi:hypothetical protein